eukprot:CAMPEP_0170363980 /NCGR_PEP_ID=MMETSP0117_2-20130122/5137_1 /TAXON_ID=400756 /ORGANISM="Durinskia baltica, Strain CSIRO CS-38" /LENGTH=188 /DNA_ID=CAMNT_0010618465 /DNA_START=287 /DNA_END=850 /DNA_ORIENTATION=-
MILRSHLHSYSIRRCDSLELSDFILEVMAALHEEFKRQGFNNSIVVIGISCNKSIILPSRFIYPPSFPQYLEHSLRFPNPSFIYLPGCDGQGNIIGSRKGFQGGLGNSVFILRKGHSNRIQFIIEHCLGLLASLFGVFSCGIKPSGFSFSRAQPEWALIRVAEDHFLHLADIDLPGKSTKDPFLLVYW